MLLLNIPEHSVTTNFQKDFYFLPSQVQSVRCMPGEKSSCELKLALKESQTSTRCYRYFKCIHSFSFTFICCLCASYKGNIFIHPYFIELVVTLLYILLNYSSHWSIFKTVHNNARIQFRFSIHSSSIFNFNLSILSSSIVSFYLYIHFIVCYALSSTELMIYFYASLCRTIHLFSCQFLENYSNAAVFDRFYVFIKCLETSRLPDNCKIGQVQ